MQMEVNLILKNFIYDKNQYFKDIIEKIACKSFN